jgi:hypothetical protein
MAAPRGSSTGSGPGQDGGSFNEDLYGKDDQGAAEKISTKLDVPDPTLDVWGEQDGRARSEGNHGKQP